MGCKSVSRLAGGFGSIWSTAECIAILDLHITTGQYFSAVAGTGASSRV